MMFPCQLYLDQLQGFLLTRKKRFVRVCRREKFNLRHSLYLILLLFSPPLIPMGVILWLKVGILLRMYVLLSADPYALNGKRISVPDKQV